MSSSTSLLISYLENVYFTVVSKLFIQELLRQRDTLNKVERDIDSISAMTKVTQRQLNGIKSIFGGIKNWFQSKNETPTRTAEVQSSGLRNSLQAYEECNQPPSSSHPHHAARLYDDISHTKVGSQSTSRQDEIDEKLGNEI